MTPESAKAFRKKLAAAWTGEIAFADLPPENGPYTCAAVLVPLFYSQGAWHVLLTRRADHLAHHSGQVAFPGGACEAHESTPEETALRETAEEIGIQPQAVRLLGRLNPSITITGYHVTPVVGLLGWPAVFRIDTGEVARVFSIPIAWLADPQNRMTLVHAASQRTVIVYRPFAGEVLWGVTARIVAQLLNIIQPA